MLLILKMKKLVFLTWKTGKRIVNRHIAWLYTFREQLLVPTEWEHISSENKFGNIDLRRNRLIKAGFPDYGRAPIFLHKYLSEEEYDLKSQYKNFATYLISQQAKDINELKNMNAITDFNQTQLQNALNDFYGFQGQAERIKNFLPQDNLQVQHLFSTSCLSCSFR